MSPFGAPQTRQSLRLPLQSPTNALTHFQSSPSFFTKLTNPSSLNLASTSTEILSQTIPTTFVIKKFCDNFAIDNNNDATNFQKQQLSDSNKIHNLFKTGNCSSLV